MKAFELISDPRRFTTHSLAIDAKGKACGTLLDSGAKKWNALGAIFWCYPGGKHNEPLFKDGPTPCAKAREIAKSKFDCSLGRLSWDEALEVLKEADV